MNKRKSAHYVLCVRNEGYPVALEVRKVYQAIPDSAGAKHGLIRIIDESGEDYLYPVDFFVYIDVPKSAERVFSAAT